MKRIINILNKEIQDTRDLIFETENKIQSEEFKKESAETKINIDALRSLKKTYEHDYNKLLDVKHLVLEMHIAEGIENERRAIE